ncbi:MAG: PAS domain S-box protein [Pseudodesulfovibrio sp.]|nr:PAS domain S-box protein [Pseudodesulfovibrio sp.]
MDKPLAVLIAEDAESDAQLIVRMLEKAGYALTYEQVETPSQMRRALEKQPWDIVISDFSMPEMDGYATLKLLQETKQDIPFIVVSGTMGEETAVAMMKAGAHDYVMKDKLARLVPAVERELIQAEERRERKRAEKQIQLNHTATLNLLQDLGKENEARKKSENALRESEVKLKQAQRVAKVGSWVWHVMSNHIEWSDEMYHIFGIQKENFCGDLTEVIKRAIHPDDLASFEVANQSAVQEHKLISLEYRVIWPDATIHVVWSEIGEVTLDEAGNSATISGIVQDISERKRTEESLLLQSTALNAAANAIMITNIDGAIEWTNPAYSTLTGYSTQEVIGKNPRELVKSSKHDQAFYKHMWDTILEGKIWFNTLINRRKDGSLYTEEQTITPLKNPDGIISHFIAIKQDVTERIKWEEEIQSRNKELSELYKLSRLLAESEDLEDVIAVVVRQAVESIHITFACIALISDGKLVSQAIYPVRNMELDFSVSNSQSISALPVLKGILEKNEPVILHASNNEISSIERTTLQLDSAQSVCLVPMKAGDLLQSSTPALGLLILGEARGNERSPFTLEKINLARNIGDQAAIAIRRMLVSEQARHRLEHITSLREIDNATSKSFDLRLSLNVILKHVCEQLNVDAADVLVVNASMQTMEFIAGRGFRTRVREHTTLRFGESLAGQAALEQRMVQIPDMASSGSVFARPELLKDDQIAAYFAVPLIIKGQVKGVLEIFHRNPLDPDEEWLDFLNTLAGQAAVAIDNNQLFYELQRSNIELGLAYDATIEGWSHALDLRDKETEGHTLRVTEMTVKLAEFFNVSNDALKQIRWGSLLHDIGKMGVPDAILLKPGPLTDDEWVVMKKHPTFAYEMISPIHYLKDALDIPYCHHEKWDGSGYPRALKGEQIPLAARIFAVVDVWDALISDRPYRKAWTKEKALEHIRSESGTHFDPHVVKLFLQEQG